MSFTCPVPGNSFFKLAKQEEIGRHYDTNLSFLTQGKTEMVGNCGMGRRFSLL